MGNEKKLKAKKKSERQETTVFEHLEYTRIQKHVYEAIAKNPTIDMRELARSSKISYPTVRASIERLIVLGYLGPKRYEVLKEIA